MVIYGVALLSFCYLAGQLFGEFLGKWLGIDANVGGVGFAMLLLVVINDWLKQKGLLQPKTEDGLNFWNQMYIPIVIAMSAIQNVKVAINSGLLAILAGVIPAAVCLMAVKYLSNFSASSLKDKQS